MAIATSSHIQLTADQEAALTRFLHRLVDQHHARTIVAPQSTGPGFWFGGGNVLEDSNGALWLVGRYRNFGDSRTGTGAGDRGLELTLFRSIDRGNTFQRFHGWSKADLSHATGEVVSIEGAALYQTDSGAVELYVSTEKNTPYPSPLEAYQKPGTGVWTIDLLAAPTFEQLPQAKLRPVLAETPEPEYLHVKDPVILRGARDETILLFADHPFTWSSLNTGFALREKGGDHFTIQDWELVPRGPAWDVAGTRITGRLFVPQVGLFAHAPSIALYFYDGLECYRSHEQNTLGVHRPRGHSCEELGGVLYGPANAFPSMRRLSRLAPLFVSPHGTGCSRYVDALEIKEGILATWQQSQPDQSQPLVANLLPREDIEGLLS